jgi:hypothetical protein
VVVAGTLQDQIVRVDLLEVGAAPVECFPIDPASGIPRKRNRLNAFWRSASIPPR